MTDHSRRHLILGGVPQDFPPLLAEPLPVSTEPLAGMPRSSRWGRGRWGEAQSWSSSEGLQAAALQARPDLGSGFHKVASGAGSGRRGFPRV